MSTKSVQVKYDNALKAFQQSLVRGRGIDDKVKIAWSLTNIGDMVAREGNHDQAANYWQEANDLFR